MKSVSTLKTSKFLIGLQLTRGKLEKKILRTEIIAFFSYASCNSVFSTLALVLLKKINYVFI